MSSREPPRAAGSCAWILRSTVAVMVSLTLCHLPSARAQSQTANQASQVPGQIVVGQATPALKNNATAGQAPVEVSRVTVQAQRPTAGQTTRMADLLSFSPNPKPLTTSAQRQAEGTAAPPIGSSFAETRLIPQNDRLLGDVGRLRPWLAKRGVTFGLTYWGEELGNVAGGRRTGFDYTHQIVLSNDVDLDKLAGLKGLSFHMLGVQGAGRNVGTDYTGVTFFTQPAQDWGSRGDVMYKLVEMYLEEKAFGGMLDVSVGRMPSNLKFGTSPFGCYAVNMMVCAHPIAVSVATKWRSWPFSEWGIMARVNPGLNLYGQVGFFEDSPRDGGRAGFDWSFNHTGFVIPMELGWEPELTSQHLSGHYKLGGYIDTSNNKDPFTSITGAPILISHQPARIEKQRGAWYAGADQMVYRFGPAPNQGLILFSILGFDVSPALPSQSQLTFGVIAQGMFPARIADRISLFWSRYETNRKITREQELQQDLGYTKLANGVTDPQSNYQLIELTYSAWLMRGVRLAPDLQYIIRPDGATTYPNALIAGFRLLVEF